MITVASVVALVAVGKIVEVAFPYHELGVVSHFLQPPIVEHEDDV